MSIYKLNVNNSIDNKIDLLNKMIIELNGLIAKARFDKNELDDLYTQLGDSAYNFSRKYARDFLLGNSTIDYSNWIHVDDQSGYSIWKIAVDSYIHNSINNLYLNGQVLDNRGEAASESLTAFDTVFLYDTSESTVYVDNSDEAASEDGVEFSLMSTTNDYLYVGSDTIFSGIDFKWQGRGSNYTLLVEYWNGADWIEITVNDNSLEENTNDFESEGSISWGTLNDWTTAIVNSITRYWIRVSTTTTPSTVAKAYLIVPTTSVIGLLALSSSQIFNEEWAWCSYAGSVYVTIRNLGNTSFEGDYYITSASTSTKLQNFFIYNNEYSLDYQQSS